MRLNWSDRRYPHLSRGRLALEFEGTPAGTKETVAIWQKAGKDVEFVTLKGEDHVFQARWTESMQAVVAFFARHLK